MAEEKKKKRNYEVNTILARILDQNPQIVPSRIQLFSEVYYPIAALEMEMTETTFEDFDLVPLAVLKFMSLGVTSAGEIAQLMGLSRNYAQKVIDLLMGYGYIDAQGITELGLESLKLGKKVTHSVVKQRFQADAITGDLLKIAEQPSELDLQDRGRTVASIPHIPHIEGISVDEINRQLMDSDLTRYKRYQGDILHSNVERIKNVVCTGLEYVKAYLVKLQGIDSPFIISYRYDSSRKEFKERFRWQPMRMPCEKAYAEYGFSREIECYSKEALKTINELYQLVCKSNEMKDEEGLKKVLQYVQPFDYSTMDISMGQLVDGVPDQISIYLNADSFRKWNAFVLAFLENYDPVSGYLYTNSQLNGLFVRFESQSVQIRMASKQYKKALRHFDRRQLNTYLRNRLFSRKEEGPIDFESFMEMLNKYEEENEEK